MHSIKCFTQREQEQIVRQFEKGMTQTELGKEWGVSRSTIYRVLENFEVEPRQLTKNDREILKVVRGRNLDKDSLVKALDQPALTVENIIKVLATSDDSAMLYILKQARTLKDQIKGRAKGELNAA